MEIQICPGPHELALAAAHRFASLADEFVRQTGRFTVVLSGGSTPRQMFSILAEKPFAESVPWPVIYFFWGDERCVPPDHPDSNYRMASETLLSQILASPENIFRMPAEDGDHDRAAANYSNTIREFFASDTPRFDLIFLGMGPDGHTASLFPHTSALGVNDRIAVANYVKKFQTYRLTLTAATINQARHVIFLVAGEDKAATLKEVLEGPPRPEEYPSQLIHPVNGELRWMIDEAAARLLTSSSGGQNERERSP